MNVYVMAVTLGGSSSRRYAAWNVDLDLWYVDVDVLEPVVWWSPLYVITTVSRYTACSCVVNQARV